MHSKALLGALSILAVGCGGNAIDDAAESSLESNESIADGTRPPSIALQFSEACQPQFKDLHLTVRGNNEDGINITAAYPGSNGVYTTKGFLQVHNPAKLRGIVQLSSEQRRQTGLLINITDNLPIAYSNIEVPPSAGGDPITGTLNIRRYEPSKGRVDLEFTGVRLEQYYGGQFCTVNGRVRTFGPFVTEQG